MTRTNQERKPTRETAVQLAHTKALPTASRTTQQAREQATKKPGDWPGFFAWSELAPLLYRTRIYHTFHIASILFEQGSCPLIWGFREVLGENHYVISPTIPAWSRIGAMFCHASPSICSR